MTKKTGFFVSRSSAVAADVDAGPKPGGDVIESGRVISSASSRGGDADGDDDHLFKESDRLIQMLFGQELSQGSKQKSR